MKRINRLGLLLLIVLARLAVADNLPSNERSSDMRLRLKSSSFGIGHVLPTTQPDVLAWQNQGFSQPFLFQLGAIRSLSPQFANDRQAIDEALSFIVETGSREAFVGRLVQLDPQTVVVQSKIYGTVSIPRADVRSMIRVEKSGEILYPGLPHSNVWTPIQNSQNSPSWEFRGGMFHALRQQAAIVGEVDLPDRCEIVLALSWKGVPDFVIRLGTTSDYQSKDPAPAAARIEVSNRNAILIRETPHNADLTRLQELVESDPQLTLRVFLDQRAGVAIAQDIHGRRLGQVQLDEDNPQIRGAVHIANYGPGLTVERFEVRAWDGISQVGSSDPHDLRLTNGQTLQGEVVALEGGGQMLVVRTKDGQVKRIAIAEISFARLGVGDDRNKVPDEPNQTAIQSADAESTVEVILADRSRIIGQWLPAANDKLGVRSTAFDKDVRFEPQQLAGMNGTSEKFTTARTDHRNGRLTLGDSELAGYLVDSPSELESLQWNPQGSLSSSSLWPDADGMILYVQRPHAGLSAMPKGNATTEGYPIRFLNGETVNAQVQRIDERGVYFQSSETQLNFVEHSRVDGVWLGPLASTAKQPTPEKLERLKIVPRSLKDDPPTHLIRSVSGDLLRCRLIELNDRLAVVEVHRDQQPVPREQIAQIIWLHDRNWQKEPTANGAPGVNPVQVDPLGSHELSIFVEQLDRGVMLVPSKLQAGVLYGKSKLLGDCKVQLNDVDRILFGSNLETRIERLEKNPWVLSLAQAPRAFAEVGGNQTPNHDTSIVGQSAPRFELKALDGRTVRLNDFAGRIVVLEFWTSWNGPSVVNLNAIRGLIADLSSTQIAFVAVNVQEAQSKAMSAAAKLQIIDCTLLDKDGSIAAAYQASALPCTVVIDSKGIVSRVLVSEGEKMQSQLRETLNDLH